MHDRIIEVQSYLDHQDYSLAVRRMLDICLDSGNGPLLREAIGWSRQYRLEEENTSSVNFQSGTAEALPAGFLEKAAHLLNKLENLSADLVHQTAPLLTADHIHKKYAHGNFSLQPISVQINTGDVLGVVGQNGHGKTTLLRCLSRQLALDGGSLEFNQLNGSPDDYYIKQHVAFIPQRIPRWRGLLKDNLHFSASLSGINGDQNMLMVDFMLERLNLSRYAHLTWEQISSGYRTRFELARIFLQSPRLLILDEPLANLDINAQQTLLSDLRYMAKSIYNPMGIILSSQQLHEVEKVADTVLFIKEGSCLFRTGDQPKDTDAFVLELETKTERDILLQILGKESAQVQFNGGFYTISSGSLSVQEMISKLVSNQVGITYLRDITHSTKRFF